MPSATPDEFSRHLDQLRAEEFAACAHRARENGRRSGVRWSGLADAPLTPRPDDALRAAAQARLATGRAWRERPGGGFVSAIASVQRCAERLHALAEQARAAAARGLMGERDHCALLLGDLTVQAGDLSAKLGAAGAALDRLEP